MSQIVLTEGAAPATPAASDVAIYVKTDGNVYKKDDTGAETALASIAGAIATSVAMAIALG